MIVGQKHFLYFLAFQIARCHLRPARSALERRKPRAESDSKTLRPAMYVHVGGSQSIAITVSLATRNCSAHKNECLAIVVNVCSCQCVIQFIFARLIVRSRRCALGESSKNCTRCIAGDAVDGFPITINRLRIAFIVSTRRHIDRRAFVLERVNIIHKRSK